MRVLLVMLVSLASQWASASYLPLQELQSLDSKSTLAPISARTSKMPDNASMRMAAMRDAALATGAQHGYAYRMDRLKKDIRRRSQELDQQYDFSSLMRVASRGESEAFLLPPVIQTATNISASDRDQRRIRTSDRMYAIDRPAKLVIRAPNWREYLLFDGQGRVSIPHQALLPETREEQVFWRDWVRQGWEAGEAQAEREMRSRVRRMANEYTGMVRYMRLEKEGKVHSPSVAMFNRAVTGDDQQMHIDDTVYELTRDARMNMDASEWKGFAMDDRESLMTPEEIRRIEASVRATDPDGSESKSADSVKESPPKERRGLFSRKSRAEAVPEVASSAQAPAAPKATALEEKAHAPSLSFRQEDGLMIFGGQ